MTTRTLHLAKDLTLPLDAATESFAILGRRGSGKTHTAVVVAEELLKAGVQVVVIDPLDVWWGLRVSKDGKTAGFSIYVAGGSHKDIPLSADAGKVLADAVVDQGLSIVLSTRHLSKTDQRRFVGEFCERLYDRKADPQHRTALHVFIDEADAFVPQRLMPGAERCFGAVDTMVRRGRSSGLAVTLISQRPQVINKDVLSQTEVLVSHQLTGPQDRKALQAWIEANDDENRSAEFMGALASLPKGRAWFWSPGLLKVFRPVDIRDRTTFDSSATPKPGVVGVKPKAFAAVDLHKLTAEIAATIEKAKADDPRELRKQIADLKRQVASGFATASEGKKPEVKRVDVLTDADRALLDGIGKRLEQMAAFMGRMKVDAQHYISEAIKDALGDITEDAATAQDAFLKQLDAKGFQKILAKLSAISNQQSSSDVSRRPAVPRADHPGRSSAATRPTETRAPRGTDRSGAAGIGDGAQQKILDVVAMLGVRGIDVNRESVARWLDIHPNGGRYGSNLAHLRAAGYLDGFRLTEQGATAARAMDTGLVAAREPLDGAQRLILDTLEAHPQPFTRESLAAALGIHPNGGRYGSNLSRLRTMGLLPDRGDIYLTEGARR